MRESMKKILLMIALFTCASWSVMAADTDKPAAVFTYTRHM